MGSHQVFAAALSPPAPVVRQKTRALFRVCTAHIMSVQREEDGRLVEPYTYVCELSDDKMRLLLIEAFNEWLQCDEEALTFTRKVTAQLQHASLLLDDIEDDSRLREGEPTAHSIFGVPSTINCANYVYFLALREISDTGKSEAVEAFTEEMIRLHKGQGLDITWRESESCPSLDMYKEMVLDKTGSLLRLAVKLMACLSKTGEASKFEPIVNSLALLYQIRDDYVNLCADEKVDARSNLTASTEENEDIAKQVAATHAREHTGKSNTFLTLNVPGGSSSSSKDQETTEDEGAAGGSSQTTPSQKKACFEDISEGKFSFPIIHAIQSNKADSRLRQILRRRTQDVRIKRHAVDYIRQCGSFDVTIQEMVRLHRQLKRQIAALGGNPRLEAIVNGMMSCIPSS